MTTPSVPAQRSDLDIPKTPGVARPLIEWSRALQLSDSLILPQTPEEFVRDGVVGRMKLFGRWNVFWRILHSISTVGTVLLGVLGSVLAALHTAHALAIIAGALIAGLTTFAAVEKPGQRSDGFRTAQLMLKDEAWDVVNHAGRYARAENQEQAYLSFYAEIDRLVKRARIAMDPANEAVNRDLVAFLSGKSEQLSSSAPAFGPSEPAANPQLGSRAS